MNLLCRFSCQTDNALRTDSTDTPVCVFRSLALIDERLAGQRDVMTLVAAFVGARPVIPLVVAVASGSTAAVSRATGRIVGEDPALRNYWYTRAFEQAIRRDDIRMIRHLHRLHPDSVGIDTLALAMKHGTLKTVKWLARYRSDCRCCGPLTHSGGRACCFRWDGHNVHRGEACHIVRWLIKHKWILFFMVVHEMIEHGNLKTLRWLLSDRKNEPYRCDFIGITMMTAASAGRLDVVRLLNEEHWYDEREVNSARCGAIAHGHNDIAEFLLLNHPECTNLDRATAIWAAGCGNLTALQRHDVMLSLVDEVLREETALTAYEHGHLKVLQWIFDLPFGGARCLRLLEVNVPTCRHSERQRMEIVQWLEREGVLTPEFAAAAIGDAARDGFLSVLQWFYSLDRFNHFFTSQLMDDAACGGHLQVVQWLHSSRFGGCTAAAMDRAAPNGHLDVVIFLHENRHEGCTTNAMDKAPLHVVHWLHAHRTEGCTKAAAVNAADRGDFQTLKFLADVVGVPIDLDVGYDAYRWQHVGILEWLKKHHPSVVTHTCRCRDRGIPCHRIRVLENPPHSRNLISRGQGTRNRSPSNNREQ